MEDIPISNLMVISNKKPQLNEPGFFVKADAD